MLFVINQKCQIQATLINLHPNENSQEFHYSSFAVKLDRCVGGCNTLNDLSNKLCIPIKIEDINLSMFNMISGINQSKTLAKHISCECECKLDGRKCNSNEWMNKDKCRCESKKHHICGNEYVWNSSTCICENEKYLANIMDDSAIICDEVVDAYEVVDGYKFPRNFNEKKVTCRTKKF